MDFISDMAAWSQKISEEFNDLEPIFEERSDTHHARVFDWRMRELDSSLLMGVRSVFAIAMNLSGEVLLVDHPKRGWEICGGHLTKAEVEQGNVIQALHREVREESGHKITKPSIAFLNLVHNFARANNKELHCPYPVHSLMAYFTCDIVKKVSDSLLDDIRGAKTFPLGTAIKLVRPRNKAILEHLNESWSYYLKEKTR